MSMKEQMETGKVFIEFGHAPKKIRRMKSCSTSGGAEASHFAFSITRPTR